MIAMLMVSMAMMGQSVEIQVRNGISRANADARALDRQMEEHRILSEASRRPPTAEEIQAQKEAEEHRLASLAANAGLIADDWAKADPKADRATLLEKAKTLLPDLKTEVFARQAQVQAKKMRSGLKEKALTDARATIARKHQLEPATMDRIRWGDFQATGERRPGAIVVRPGPAKK